MTKIEWCDETLNPFAGCSKISEGCRNCYAEKMAKRLKAIGLKMYQDVTDNNGWTGNIGYDLKQMEKAVNWKKSKRIFIGSMGDVFHSKMSVLFQSDMIDYISSMPRHEFILCTKRPDNALAFFEWLNEALICDGHEGLDCIKNLTLLISVENQEQAAERIPIQWQCRKYVGKLGLSIEPMLEKIDFYKVSGAMPHKGHPWLNGPILSDIDWIIFGVETGPGRRSCSVEDMDYTIRQCLSVKVPVFVKSIEVNGKVEKDISKLPEHLRAFPEEKEEEKPVSKCAPLMLFPMRGGE